MKLRNLIAICSLGLAMGACALTSPKEVQQVSAADEEEQVEVMAEKQEKFIDELVTPLLIALCSADGITIVSMGVVGYLRHKKEKAREVAHKAQTELLAKGIEKMSALEEKTVKLIESFETTYNNVVAIVEEEKTVLIQHAEDVKKVGELKTAMVCMAEAQLAQIKTEEENVRNGLSHEISELQEKLKALK